MHVLIIALGSRGDVQPYIALGQGLARAGHRVRLLTNAEFADLVRSYDLEVCPVDINVQAAMQAPDASAAIEGGNLLTSFLKLTKLATSRTRLVVEAGLTAARTADVIVAGFGGMFVAASLAEKLGLSFVQAYNVPMTPTREYAGALFPWLSFWPRSLTHRLSHRLTRQMVWQAARSAGNAARRDLLGLPAAPVRGMFDSPLFNRAPTLYGFSQAVLPRPADWPANVHVTGFWYADEPETWTPPRELVEFIEGGPVPVYIGFGSMSSEKPDQTTRVVLDALAAHGRRAVVHSGWAGLGATPVPENVFVVGSVPHSWLLPRMAAAVHHGGAGTTAAAFRAGLPSVVVPFHGDQPFWAQLTERLGVGTKPIPRRKLDAGSLAHAIEEAVGSPEMRRKAAALGEKIRGEDGVRAAVSLIEEAFPPSAG